MNEQHIAGSTDEQLLESLREVNEHWSNPLVHQVCERFAELMKELKSSHAFERSVNEALNSGDGSYRP